MITVCPATFVERSLGHMREAGRRNCECVVLWLGRRGSDSLVIEDIHLPIQSARADMFHIPRAGMTTLFSELRRRRMMVAAQIHSHPRQAFHSAADDRWAIIRHQGALSLVVPDFAAKTTLATFFDDTKVYQFSSAAQWIEVSGREVASSCLRIS